MRKEISPGHWTEINSKGQELHVYDMTSWLFKDISDPKGYSAIAI